ncbi:polysaccharide deacetylase family protein [Albimonas sp. CAU 1670]|uniref:polysaccharide deacetylase family protein n=1 Tax=Albimonas sp. CAU 1670 TaxID=3032599 RepID=UPI0023DB4B97|nr:polysaccharide deacetylase family protein [Albimonas sp. CAU 1670]MDF2231815.1 polysaccharide deacetylase family protein [Albimonas sp. CAU 1670]
MDDRRNLRGWWDGAPPPPWPEGRSLAVSVVVNVEEGAEFSVADGDAVNERLPEANQRVEGLPDPCMESQFAYGARAGFRRVLDALAAHAIPATFSTCGRAAERTPWLLQAAVAAGHEVSCHGWRWESHAGMAEAAEREAIARTYAAILAATGEAPVGWHTRSASSPNTRRLLGEHGGFLYDSDAYDDDLPYVVEGPRGPHVVLPYGFDANDMRFEPGGGFIHGRDFADYCLAAVDRLVVEGAREARMLSIGLHPRLIGRPARIGGLETTLAEIARLRDAGRVWPARRRDIARVWRAALGLAPWPPSQEPAP